MACLAEVISRFDVVAVQEARRSPRALKHLLATTAKPLLRAGVHASVSSQTTHRMNR
ncbi:UNVERIFIED_ORG: hypothetical protein ABIB13_002267 [Arthrobacter sp. UYEF2]